MKSDRNPLGTDGTSPREFDEDTTNLFHLFIGSEKMLVAQQIPESKFLCFALSFQARAEGAVLCPQLFGRVASHPEGFDICHVLVSRGTRSRLGAARARQATICCNCGAARLLLSNHSVLPT